MISYLEFEESNARYGDICGFCSHALVLGSAIHEDKERGGVLCPICWDKLKTLELSRKK